jgi:hypothetical protein
MLHGPMGPFAFSWPKSKLLPLESSKGSLAIGFYQNMTKNKNKMK